MRGMSLESLLNEKNGAVLIGKATSNPNQQQSFSGKSLTVEDVTPTISGKLSAALEIDEQIGIYVDNNRVGTATVVNRKDWSYTLPTQTIGKHSITVSVESASFEMRLSESIDVIIFSGSTQGVSSFSAIESLINGEVSVTVVTDAQLSAGQKIAIYDGLNKLGYADTLISGEWKTTLKGVGNGLHALTAKIIGADGVVSTGAIGSSNLTISHTEPTQIISVTSAVESNSVFNYAAPAIHQATDIYKLWVTADTTPSYYGKITSALNSGSITGESIKVYDNGTEIAGAVVSLNGLDWTYTAPVLSEGQHSLTFKVVNGVNEGVASSSYVIEVDALVSTIVQITKVVDTAGALTGSLVSGDTTDDAKWEISGTLSEAQTGRIEIYNSGVKIASFDVFKTSVWNYNLDPVASANNSLTAKFINTAGISGSMSAAFNLTVGNQDGVLTATTLAGGIDAVSLSGQDQMLDLTQVSSTSIDQVNLGAWGGNTLKLTSTDVTDSGQGLFSSDYTFSLVQDAINASRYHQMLVNGSGVALRNSTVILADNIAIDIQPWTLTGTATKNSSVYDVYTNFADSNQLLIQQGLVVI